MKDWLGNLGNNPKFDTLVKLAFYSLFVFAAIILINTADMSDYKNDQQVDDDTNEKEKIANILELSDNYTYKYNITVNDKIYSYQGTVVNTVDTFKKNKDNEIFNYKYENGVYYILEKEEYKVIDIQNVYDIVDFEYLSIDKIKQYFDNAEYKDNKYYTYLKDMITGENTDVYIAIEIINNKIVVDYSKLDDEKEIFIVEFEYEERIKGENDESEEEQQQQ